MWKLLLLPKLCGALSYKPKQKELHDLQVPCSHLCLGSFIMHSVIGLKGRSVILDRTDKTLLMGHVTQHEWLGTGTDSGPG